MLIAARRKWLCLRRKRAIKPIRDKFITRKGLRRSLAVRLPDKLSTKTAAVATPHVRLYSTTCEKPGWRSYTAIDDEVCAQVRVPVTRKHLGRNTVACEMSGKVYLVILSACTAVFTFDTFKFYRFGNEESKLIINTCLIFLPQTYNNINC